MSEEEEKNILKLLDDKARTSVPGKAYETLHNGSDEKGIPPRAIYKIGMKILESHLKNNPDESIKDWTEKPSEKIVKESDYSELLEKTDIVESSAD